MKPNLNKDVQVFLYHASVFKYGSGSVGYRFGSPRSGPGAVRRLETYLEPEAQTGGLEKFTNLAFAILSDWQIFSFEISS
jgi:hypothetical protein